MGQTGRAIIAGLVAGAVSAGLVSYFVLGNRITLPAISKLESKVSSVEADDLTKKKNVSPSFGSISFSDVIGFHDDFAPGMRAYIILDGNESQIERRTGNKRISDYDFPSDIIKYNSFEVYAEDRDGNKSERKKLYVVDGIIVDSLPEEK